MASNMALKSSKIIFATITVNSHYLRFRIFGFPKSEMRNNQIQKKIRYKPEYHI
ncbi:hypothetical protein TTHERM_000458198 (macronuclear) [Tetrahymena thermophila SB210]|uniref:Uncharacterized protein n=1 Tax=Tetrahymena thermophila (strain SB210) TaxID=312017 RepID=W7XDQ9_TETTS|nr:hypothetical protein TTHERM_000458198 [Tetrahymena thermophila SB210]EWS71991.1 hypothetical protein TTHERM_000458198 [Tetrahymena thermophila SB210]|eukprot:XP_012655491.1 hypothetical protein TTHERM_000458198 [Tetrahymena thermophila SB210]